MTDRVHNPCFKMLQRATTDFYPFFVYHMDTRYTANLKLLNHIFFLLVSLQDLAFNFQKWYYMKQMDKGLLKPRPNFTK